jgi:hypothetical protein
VCLFSFPCCRQPAGSTYGCAHVGHCLCGRFLEWAAKSISSRWSILARQKTWSSIRLLSSKMSARCPKSVKGGCSSHWLSTEAGCPDFVASLLVFSKRLRDWVTVPVVASRGVSYSTKQVGKCSSGLLDLKSF